jgi:hypothetical protein
VPLKKIRFHCLGLVERLKHQTPFDTMLGDFQTVATVPFAVRTPHAEARCFACKLAFRTELAERRGFLSLDLLGDALSGPLGLFHNAIERAIHVLCPFFGVDW